MQKNCLLLVSLLSCLTTLTQTTLIPDINFEEALIDLGVDLNPVPDGGIPTSWIADVTSLNVNTEGINDLTGIEDFISLEELDCSQNNLGELDLSSNLALKFIASYGCSLDTIILGEKPFLEVLSCSMNNLFGIDLSLVPNLITLECNSNYIETIDLSYCPALEVLHCSENSMNELDLSANLNLWRVKCNSNELNSLDVSMLIQLKYLYCILNNLTSLDLTSNINLIKVECHYNLLEELLFGENTYLELIECSDNNIVNLNLENCPILEDLLCGNNELVHLNLSQNTQLQQFYFYNNHLVTINLRNGNNTVLSDYFGENNPDLICINVDNSSYSEINWPEVDDISVYSEECFTAINGHTNEDIKIYYSSVAKAITIDLSENKAEVNLIVIQDIMGRTIYENGNLLGSTQKITTENLTSGYYIISFVQKHSGIKTTTKLFIQ